MNDPASHRDLQALRDLFTSNRQSDKEAIALALNAAEKAVDKANEANEKRLDGLNELRQLTNDQAAQFVHREVAEARWQSIEKVSQSNSERLASIEGRFLAIAAVASIASIAGVIYALVK